MAKKKFITTAEKKQGKSDILKTGGKINTAKETWQSWNSAKRIQFLMDNIKDSTPASLHIWANKSYDFLPKKVKDSIKNNATSKSGTTSITNQYSGKTPKEVWEALDQNQRMHFIYDHGHLFPNALEATPPSVMAAMSWSEFAKLDDAENEAPSNVFVNHIHDGQYKDGGLIPGFTDLSADELWVIEMYKAYKPQFRIDNIAAVHSLQPSGAGKFDKEARKKAQELIDQLKQKGYITPQNALSPKAKQVLDAIKTKFNNKPHQAFDRKMYDKYWLSAFKEPQADSEEISWDKPYNNKSVLSIIQNEGIIYAINNYMDGEVIADKELAKIWDETSAEIDKLENELKATEYAPGILGHNADGYFIIQDNNENPYKEVPVSELPEQYQPLVESISSKVKRIAEIVGIEWTELYKDGGLIPRNRNTGGSRFKVTFKTSKGKWMVKHIDEISALSAYNSILAQYHGATDIKVEEVSIKKEGGSIETSENHNYVADTFTIDDETEYTGYHVPTERWNGWATPVFEKEVAMHILADTNTPYKWSAKLGNELFYDPEHDPDGESGNEQWTSAGPIKITVNGEQKEVYEIGPYNWTWSSSADYAKGGPITSTIRIIEDEITNRSDDGEPHRIYHKVAGVYKNYYFTAKTNTDAVNRHKDFIDSINNGGITQLELWKLSFDPSTVTTLINKMDYPEIDSSELLVYFTDGRFGKCKTNKVRSGENKEAYHTIVKHLEALAKSSGSQKQEFKEGGNVRDSINLEPGDIYELPQKGNGAKGIYTIISKDKHAGDYYSYSSDSKGTSSSAHIVHSNSWLGKIPKKIGHVEHDKTTKIINGKEYSYYYAMGDMHRINIEMAHHDDRYVAFMENADKKLRNKYKSNEDKNHHHENAKMVDKWFTEQASGEEEKEPPVVTPVKTTKHQMELEEFKHRIWLIKPFMGAKQLKALEQLCKGEEKEAGYEIITRLSDIIDGMPKTYGTEKQKANDKIIYLHYFGGGSDFYIVEKDSEPEQLQAYGYTILNGDLQNAEWGYISIDEIKSIGTGIRAGRITHGIEIDFYWTPKTFGEVMGEVKPQKQDEPAGANPESLFYGELQDELRDRLKFPSVVYVHGHGLEVEWEGKKYLIRMNQTADTIHIYYIDPTIENIDNAAYIQVFAIPTNSYQSNTELADRVQMQILIDAEEKNDPDMQPPTGPTLATFLLQVNTQRLPASVQTFIATLNSKGDATLIPEDDTRVKTLKLLIVQKYPQALSFAATDDEIKSKIRTLKILADDGDQEAIGLIKTLQILLD